MTDEFDDALDLVPSAVDRRPRVMAGTETTNNIPELVSDVYEKAPAPLRTKLLECLLGPVGPLALVAIATGAFGHLLYRLRQGGMPVSLDDAARITPNHVLELARFVEQSSPDALLQLGSLIADSPIGVATMSDSALLPALRTATAK